MDKGWAHDVAEREDADVDALLCIEEVLELLTGGGDTERNEAGEEEEDRLCIRIDFLERGIKAMPFSETGDALPRLDEVLKLLTGDMGCGGGEIKGTSPGTGSIVGLAREFVPCWDERGSWKGLGSGVISSCRAIGAGILSSCRDAGGRFIRGC
jgi:hypothetical protein